jgi:hypothetical protein
MIKTPLLLGDRCCTLNSPGVVLVFVKVPKCAQIGFSFLEMSPHLPNSSYSLHYLYYTATWPLPCYYLTLLLPKGPLLVLLYRYPAVTLPLHYPTVTLPLIVMMVVVVLALNPTCGPLCFRKMSDHCIMGRPFPPLHL